MKLFANGKLACEGSLKNVADALHDTPILERIGASVLLDNGKRMNVFEFLFHAEKEGLFKKAK